MLTCWPSDRNTPVYAYLGIGSNLGDRAAWLRRAIELLSRQVDVDGVRNLIA